MDSIHGGREGASRLSGVSTELHTVTRLEMVVLSSRGKYMIYMERLYKVRVCSLKECVGLVYKSILLILHDHVLVGCWPYSILLTSRVPDSSSTLSSAQLPIIPQLPVTSVEQAGDRIAQ